MTCSFLKKFIRFRRSEKGGLAVEFVVLFPLYLVVILCAVEYALISVKQVMLERAVDIVVRDIRLGTGSGPTHDQIKDAICDRSLVIEDCTSNLQLEMIRQSAFTGVTLPEEPDCTDRAEPAKPVREFSNGPANELMILRACAQIDPVFPGSDMAVALVGDDGVISLSATTAFVQEP
ncbi:Flp pilus assembly protein TadG [Ruegeria denitrificans]|uniref:Flp pilus assembly protein TadG n=1 Tax=Ruegeria denitrificans TaxID=1715692 RepID=A0A0P1I5G4_9RHOB|nr:TadE/TadG family type IV pilus assembly protein [Ruegeria denitrificans]CUJ91250.1 Flp pilus assembly protein TadG [Ruegeria denitrificans]